MSGLVRRTGQRAVGAPAKGRSPIVDVGGRNLSDDSWSGEVLGLDSAGMGVDTTGSITWAVTDEQGVRRRQDSSYYRLRIGWLAFPRHLVVARLEQPLYRGTDHKLHTSGPYQPVKTTRYDAVSEASRRAGAVPYDSHAAGGTSPAQDAGVDATAQLRTRFACGVEALMFLPASVRQGVLRRVSTAHTFTGQAVQHNSGDRHEVSLVGITAGTGIVVHARTHRDATSWDVDQYLYEWTPERDELATTSRRRLDDRPRHGLPQGWRS